MRTFRAIAWTFAVLSLGACTGCYDGKLLLDEARSTAPTTRLAEVDLGRLRTTLPRDQKTRLFTEVNLHLFATVPRSRAAMVQGHLRAEGYRLRHELLAAVRDATPEELSEPSLAKFRERIQRVINDSLEGHPVKSIGFYQLALRHG